MPTIPPIVGHVALGVYALLLAVGGILGFVRARSKASLISGLLSAVFAVVALGLAYTGSAFGFPLGLMLALCLFVLFGYRYAIRNRKFMPAGLLAVVSLVMIGVMVIVMDWSP